MRNVKRFGVCGSLIDNIRIFKIPGKDDEIAEIIIKTGT